METAQLPDIPNDSAHPLRPFVFYWYPSSHLNGETWHGATYRDEFHRATKIERIPRRSRNTSHNRPMGNMYRFDGEDNEITFDEFLERLRKVHGEHVGQVQNHPLVLSWKEGNKIDYTPSPPAYPIGSHVRKNYSDLPEELRSDFLERDQGKTGIVKKGNALYVLVEWGNRKQWLASWKVDPVK